MRAEEHVARTVAIFFGCGLWPWGPGTAGSAAAVLIAAAFAWTPRTCAVVAAFAVLPSVWAAGVEARSSGREDPGHIVIDEVVGQWITLAGASHMTPAALLLGFGLFRVLDILKPPPARFLEDLPGGVGIMADDVMAGIYGAALLYLAGWTNLY